MRKSWNIILSVNLDRTPSGGMYGCDDHVHEEYRVEIPAESRRQALALADLVFQAIRAEVPE